METGPITLESTPRPERALRAIWAGRAARSREAASTDRGWASSALPLLALALLILIGHATIPPGLRPFLGRTAQAEEHQHRKDPAMDAVFAKINDAIGEDVQEIDPDLGVGNVSKYVGPALVPDGATGKAFTAKVKIAESKAKSDRPPAPANDAANDAGADADEEPTLEQEVPSSRGGLRLGGRTARLMAQAAAEKAASEHAPPVSVPEVERRPAGGGSSRARAIAVAIGALGVVVAVGVWVVAKGPREVVGTPVPAGSGTATVAPAVPAVESSGGAGVAPALSAAPVGTTEIDAGASLAPSAPTGPAPYKPKGRGKTEDPYDAAAPAPAITVAPIAPLPPSTVTPIAPAPSATTPKNNPVENTSVF